MDDLLKAFQSEVSPDLDFCEAALERLLRPPVDAAAVADLHKRLCSIREMSVVLGQRELSELASRGIAALEVARRGEPGIVANAVPIVGECLAQIRVTLRAFAPLGETGNPEPAGEGDALFPPPVAHDTAAPPTRSALPRSESDRLHDHGTPFDHGDMKESPLPELVEGRTAVIPRSGGKKSAASSGSTRRRWYRPRNVLLAGGTTILAAAAAVLVVLFSADPNDYRGVFESTLQSATGRDVSIGSIEFAVSLSPTIVLEDVTLANAEWGSRRQMVAADRVEVQMALLPLLRGELKGKRFILHGADILLETNASGRGNWELDANGAGAGSAEDSEATTLPQLRRLAIEDSTLSYRDGLTGETETFELARVTAHQGEQASLLDIDVDAIVNGEAVTFAGTVGGFDLLQASAPYPVDITGAVAGLAVALKGEIAQPLQGRGYSLALTASGESLAGLGSMLATDLPPGSPVHLTAILEDAESAIRIRDIAAQIGRSDASGEIVLRPGEPNWQIDADLDANQIDLDDFILADGDAKPGPDDSRLFSAKPLPYRWMGRIDMVGNVAADRVIYGDTAMTGAALEGTIAAGRLMLDRLQFGYAGGEVALTATGDVNPPAPLWTLQGSGRGLAGGETLGLLGLTMIRGGTADLQIGVAASGGSLRDIATTLNGSGGMTLANGHIDDDLMRLFLTDLTQAVSLRGGSAQLRCMTAIYDFTEGSGRARSFVADTGAAVVSGVGQVSLGNETIGMTFQPAAKDVSLAALAVPVHVTGPLGNPDVTPDPVRATANVAGSAAGLATGGLAGAVLGLVGADVALDDAPLASCTALPGSIVTPERPATTTQAKPATAKTQPSTATTTQTRKKTTKKAAPKSTTDQILDGAGDVVDNVGSALGDVFGGSSSSSASKKPSGSKRDK